MSLSENFLDVHREVDDALRSNRPVVALESTIIAHGMPHPQNLELAMRLGQIIREAGAVPATIGVIAGKLKVGLTDRELEQLATEKGVLKLSRPDLPFAVSQKGIGATTVASTMLVAEMAGIQFFATGGAGGVHRGAESTFDISADLTEFSKTNIAVISAGVKAILDIPKTLEVLETLGVPVIGYQTDDFPAFYSQSSGQKVNYRLDDVSEVSAFIHTKWKMGLNGGILIANPIPAEHSIDRKELEPIILDAIREAAEKDISGKKLTPFLLDKLKEETKGKSLDANIALVENNARLAAKLAVSYCNLPE